jgi:F-actin capping protein, beta subunit
MIQILINQVEQDFPLESPSSHIPNLGRMIEDQEIKIRHSLQEVYFGKCKDIVNDLRSLEKVSVVAGDRKAHGLVVEGLAGKVQGLSVA